MKKLRLREQAMMYSFFAFLYIVLVSLLLMNGEKLFGGTSDNVTAPIAMLLLLVLSVSVMGMLVFGKPVVMYLDGQKEAVKLAIYTIICLFVITVIFFGILFFVK